MSGYRKTDRKMPARKCPIAEDAPVEIHKMWKDRAGNALVFSLKSYQGHPFFDARMCFSDSDGRLKATAKGITVAPSKLLEVAKAIEKAIRAAQELGLLDDEASS